MNEKFIKLRNNCGLTQKQIAEYLEVDQSYISKMEKGERPISLDLAEKLAILNGYDLSYFLEENTKEPLSINLRSNTLHALDLRNLARVNEIALSLKWMNELLRKSKHEK